MNSRIIILFLSLFALNSCTHEKKTIAFKKIANLDLGNLTKREATLRGTAVFMNLSDQEFNLKDLVLDFTIDGKDIGTVVSKTKKVIKPNSEFSVPIVYSYSTSSVLTEGREPASSYAVELLGDLMTKNSREEEISTPVKFADTYEYLTKKEKRIEKREARKAGREDSDDSKVEEKKPEKMIDRKEERRKRREARRAKNK
ncbi:MAG: hypothetical protein JWN78_2419 [Bacteroidota bacterium]|nr:hypothetical protein [Bacteroidota bacterium]